jgi:hypothetical protein
VTLQPGGGVSRKPLPPGRPAKTALTDTADKQATCTARTTLDPTLRHEYSRPAGGRQQLRRGVAVPQVTPQARRAQKGMPVELLTSCLPTRRQH